MNQGTVQFLKESKRAGLVLLVDDLHPDYGHREVASESDLAHVLMLGFKVWIRTGQESNPASAPASSWNPETHRLLYSFEYDGRFSGIAELWNHDGRGFNFGNEINTWQQSGAAKALKYTFRISLEDADAIYAKRAEGKESPSKVDQFFDCQSQADFNALAKKWNNQKPSEPDAARSPSVTPPATASDALPLIEDWHKKVADTICRTLSIRTDNGIPLLIAKEIATNQPPAPASESQGGSRNQLREHAGIADESLAGQWLPIESAPKDWSNVILFLPEMIFNNPDYDQEEEITQGWWDCDEGRWDICHRELEIVRDIRPTLWMPLPHAPGADQKPEQSREHLHAMAAFHKMYGIAPYSYEALSGRFEKASLELLAKSGGGKGEA